MSKKVLFIRLAEILIVSVILSTGVCLMCVGGCLPINSVRRNIVLNLLPIAYIIWNFISLRRCYIVLCNDRKYYLSNLVATLVFVGTSIVAFIILPRKLYSWIFLITGLGSFLNVKVPAAIAIFLFHTIVFISIFLAPVGFGWIKEKELEKEEFISRMPGMLEVNPLESKSENKVETDGKQE